MKLLKSLGLALLIGATSLTVSVRAEDTVKVGVLHSLSGTMAISETSLRDVLLFTFDEINKPGVSNLLTILSALTDTPIDTLVQEFEGRGYGDLKSAVADAVTEFATPYRNRTFELLEERGELESILAKGADRAREVASATLADVYDKVGLV